MKNTISIVLICVLSICFLGAQTTGKSAQSFFSDLKAHQVGDVITVLVVEQANASRESKVKSSSRSDLSAEGSMKGNITDFLPLFGASSGLSNSYDGQEGTKQSERLTGKISATIVEETGHGMFRIQGERTLEVNGEKNVMQLKGLVRSRDIHTDNTVYSYNVANAQIIYRKSGVTNKFLKPGSFNRLFTWVLGIGLIAASLFGVIG